jgi:two-component system chemotaxis response regulator CheB
MSATVKVLIVDDSALVREVLREVLDSEPGIEVVGVANDPYVAVERMREVTPDVLVLDIEMPKMDGITFLKKLMRQHPIPTVVCSTLVAERSETAILALESGAVELIAKPTLGTKRFLEESRVRLCDAVKAASRARVKRRGPGSTNVIPKLTADAVMPAPNKPMLRTTQRLVAIGASTGGTEAIRLLLGGLPIDSPAILVVQHMPEPFTRSFAARLNDMVALEVKEAEDGDAVLQGRALIARGDHHLLLERSGARYYVSLNQGPLVSRHRPSVDVLFRSTAAAAGKNAVGVILTGMGDDGARGMREMRDAGAATIAQDEESSVVYGMPAEAVGHGGVEQILPLQRIAEAILRSARA